jgi:hypothetical protein
MILDRVTITGADVSIEPLVLAEASKEYPFVEWGILFGTAMGGPRFPTHQWVKDLVQVKAQNKDMKLSAHLCGRFVRDIVLEGSLSFKSIYPQFWEIFDRIQLNFHGRWHKASEGFMKLLPQFKGKQLIFQIDGVNDSTWWSSKAYGDCVPFFDASHGAGISPEEWPKPYPGAYNGYSGGLGPDNLATEIPKILKLASGPSEAADDKHCWVDMETKVRSKDDTQFRLDKVRACLSAAAPFINKEA